ncbi:hypothetical protein [Saccharomonospora azurea]|uniref:hypothetical protein n=1 Tax=Saccharomonospora azurea TaxID=40988 RepID=UPI0020D22162|nr:hypothetical protein [Saccharomonospora azurea]
MEKLAKTIESVHHEMAEHDPSDYEGLQQHTDRLRGLEAEVEELEESWLELSEQLG